MWRLDWEEIVGHFSVSIFTLLRRQVKAAFLKLRREKWGQAGWEIVSLSERFSCFRMWAMLSLMLCWGWRELLPLGRHFCCNVRLGGDNLAPKILRFFATTNRKEKNYDEDAVVWWMSSLRYETWDDGAIIDFHPWTPSSERTLILAPKKNHDKWQTLKQIKDYKLFANATKLKEKLKEIDCWFRSKSFWENNWAEKIFFSLFFRSSFQSDLFAVSSQYTHKTSADNVSFTALTALF